MIRSVQRALRLLDEVAGSAEGIGLRELARRTDLAPATAHNLVKTLQASGYVAFDEPSGRYYAGLAAIRVAENANPARAAAQFVSKEISQLFEALNETVVVLMLHRNDVTVVDWREPDHPLAVRFRDDVDRCPFQMASGKALMAWQPEGWVRGYIDRFRHVAGVNSSPEEVEHLLAELLMIRKQGYARSENVANSGVGAVGVPVFDAAGNVALSVGVSAPLSRLDETQYTRHLELLQEAAGRLTARLQQHSPSQ